MRWTDRFNFASKTKQEQEPSSSLSLLDDYVQLTPEAHSKLHDLQDAVTSNPLIVLGVGCAISFGLGVHVGRRYLQNPFWYRFTNVADLPSSYFDKNIASQQWLKGRVVSVSDGDTVRFLHVPTVFHSKTLKDDEKLSETALSIRICTIDTPETAKFGKPGQPFGEEAKEYLENMTSNTSVQARLLMKDQYGRAVAELKVGRFWPFRKYCDQEMLKAGLAEVYQGSGAVYGRLGKEKYLKIEEEARSKKKGIWSKKDRESAAEYKARTK